MFSRFFIDRPIFAAVLAIFIVIAGLSATRSLPIAQYPEIAPPVVTVRAVYPGASAQVLEQTVAAPLENQINGVEGMIYFASNASSDGTVTITATFEVGTDVDRAVFQVNNRVQVALPRLPEEVRRNGVVVQKRSNDILLVIALTSPKGTLPTTAIADSSLWTKRSAACTTLPSCCTVTGLRMWSRTRSFRTSAARSRASSFPRISRCATS